MTRIKSYDVGRGDMFYIDHANGSFTVIDCNLTDSRADEILDEVEAIEESKDIDRFISTHPDEDHVHGLDRFDDRMPIYNFYCVANAVTKEQETWSFRRYKALRDSGYAYHVYQNCFRRWLNRSDENRKGAGLSFLWPDTANADYQAELAKASEGGNCNNISPIIRYSLKNGVSALWMGDLEAEFMKCIDGCVDLPLVDILFAPHHGRDSGRPPESWLRMMQPQLVVIGCAPSEDLWYYDGYDRITQNRAGDILFDCGNGVVDVFVSSETYSVDFLEQRNHDDVPGMRYIGSLDTYR